MALLSPAAPIDGRLLDTMRDRIAHRGPDNGSSWIEARGRVGFGHRRLAIIDTSHAADQPMVSADGNLRLIFNGEIYNYIELRDELRGLGVEFKTHSDTEVLLAALATWKEEALPRLNGMFAFVLWDACSRRLLVARDRFGEKPLFIGRGRPATVVIASEMKAILAHPHIRTSISGVALERFGQGAWYEDDERTFFEAIERMPPATAAWLKEDGTEERRWRYWTPDYTAVNTDLAPREAVERFAELLQRSVTMRLRADVPLGSSLSGGLDSSVIVGMLARERKNLEFKQNTFSAVFPDDPTISEHREIEAVVRHTGVNSYQVAPDPWRLARESLMLHYHQEEPFLSASIYLQWCVARLARSHDTTVLLDGQGADELLAGYQFYFRQWQLDLLDRGERGLAQRETAKFTRRLRNASNQYRDATRRFNAEIALSADEVAGYSLVTPRPAKSVYLRGVPPSRPGLRLRKTLSEALLFNSLPMLLRYADRNAMAFSREGRLPYLDHDLVDFTLTVPDHYYIRHGWQKWILRQAAGTNIPPAIRWRADKVGYAAPLDLWLRKELKDWGAARVFNARLAALPGYDVASLQRLWDEHQGNLANHSWALWKWISLSEWLALHDGGWWRAGSTRGPELD